MSLIQTIIDIVLPPREEYRRVREADIDSLAKILQPEPVVTGTHEATGLLHYTDPLVKACVVEAKFRRNKKAQELLGAALEEYLREYLSEAGAFTPSTSLRSTGAARALLIPIPLSRERRRQRGHNQVENICEVAAARLGDALTLAPAALARVRNTAPQTSLSGRKRRENMQGAFSAASPLDPSLLYIVIDDVTTTGATLLAACDALAAAGATHIIPIALTH